MLIPHAFVLIRSYLLEYSYCLVLDRLCVYNQPVISCTINLAAIYDRGGKGGGGLSLPCKMIVGLCQGPAGTEGGGRRFLQQLHPQPTQPLHPVLLGHTPCGRPRLPGCMEKNMGDIRCVLKTTPLSPSLSPIPSYSYPCQAVDLHGKLFERGSLNLSRIILS